MIDDVIIEIAFKRPVPFVEYLHDRVGESHSMCVCQTSWDVIIDGFQQQTRFLTVRAILAVCLVCLVICSGVPGVMCRHDCH
jgi:hypothetical protein